MVLTDNNKIDTLEEVVVEVKSIFLSRTFWVNAIALIAFLIQRQWGFVIDEATQMAVLSSVNIWLRSITNTPVKWRKPKAVLAAPLVDNEEGK